MGCWSSWAMGGRYQGNKQWGGLSSLVQADRKRNFSAVAAISSCTVRAGWLTIVNMEGEDGSETRHLVKQAKRSSVVVTDWCHNSWGHIKEHYFKIFSKICSGAVREIKYTDRGAKKGSECIQGSWTLTQAERTWKSVSRLFILIRDALF